MKSNDPKFKNEIFVRIDMKHSYFSKLFVCNEFFLLLPVRASKQGNVIGLVSMYVYIYIYIYHEYVYKKNCN